MKNPMTPEQMKQAIDDNAAGHDMQWRLIGGVQWRERAVPGGELNFQEREYRRKPQLRIAYCNEYEHGDYKLFKTLEEAERCEGPFFIHRSRLVEDTTWTKPEQETNPWLPIIDGEWPEHILKTKLLFKYPDGEIVDAVEDCADCCGKTEAIAWKYKEDYI